MNVVQYRFLFDALRRCIIFFGLVVISAGCTPHLTYLKTSSNIFDKYVMRTYSQIPGKMEKEMSELFNSEFPLGTSADQVRRYMVDNGGSCMDIGPNEMHCMYENGTVVIRPDSIFNEVASRSILTWNIVTNSSNGRVKKSVITLENKVSYQ